jgi:hypothetical protein
LSDPPQNSPIVKQYQCRVAFLSQDSVQRARRAVDRADAFMECVMTSLFRAAAFGWLLLAAPALAADITLDQTELKTGEIGRITFKSIVLSDSDLTQGEAASLFSGALSREESGAMLDRLTARELKIPEAEIRTESGSRFTLHDIVAAHIAKGSAESVAIGSVDGVLPDDSGDSALHSGALRLGHVALPGLGAALRAGDIGLAAFRFDHLDWEGGELLVVEKGTAAGAPGGNRIVLRVGAARIDQTLDADGAPDTVVATFSDLSVKMPPQSRAGATLSAFGYPQIDADAHFSASYDAATKTYKLADYSLDFRKIGRLAVSGQASNLEKAALTGGRPQRQAALEAATVDWGQIDVTDAGLFEKIVAFVALNRGAPPATIKAEWRAIVAQAPLLAAGAPAVGVTARALDRFIVDPKNLSLRFKGRDAPLTIGELTHIEDPIGFIGRLDVTSPGVKP